MQEGITLKVTKGQLRGAEFTFDSKRSLVIGRQNDCGICLPDKKISRYHCEVYVDPPHVRVRDLESMNGTWRNGVLIGRRNTVMDNDTHMFTELKDGDYLGIGTECEMTLCIPVSSEDGQKIPGYQKLKLLGKGSVGEVWSARRETDGEEFALKLIDTRGMKAVNQDVLFYRESNLLGQLTHSHIVKQYDSGEQDGLFYIVQELCRGNVRDLMRHSGGVLPVKTATHIILQVLTALDFAHHARLVRADGKVKKGLVHRDIKPDNILLMDYSSRPAAKIGDFGLSKLFELTGITRAESLIDPTQKGEFAGTPDFTPAIQIKYYRDAKPEVDVWAAAASYYYMLTGLPPKDLSYAEKWKLALIEKAIPIRERNPDIPEKLAEVIDTALSEEPDIGYKSAGELKRRIEAVL